MKVVTLQEDWPQSWRSSYQYDQLEVYSKSSVLGYTYAYTHRCKHILELIQKAAKPGAKVLDVATAQGNFSLSLAEMGYEVTWNDLREDLVDYIKLKHERGSVHYAPGNILSLDFDSYFDVVLIAEVIEHTAHPDDFLKKITQMVKPGGFIVMNTPNGEYFRNRLPKFSDCPDPSQFESIQFQPDSDGHIFLLHLDEVKALSHQAGLIIRETRLFVNSLTNGHLKLGLLLEVLPHRWVDACESLTQNLPLLLQKKLCVSMATLFQRSYPSSGV